MGGNAAVINRVTGLREIEASKINIGMFGREFIKKEVNKIMIFINDKFQEKYYEPLWLDSLVIENNDIFNGSSEVLMGSDIDDREFEDLKSTIGDIDVIVPKWKKKELWFLLEELQNKQITENVCYLGNNKPTVNSIGHQINSVFNLKKGVFETNFQIDFEFLDFDSDKPSTFSKFSHSSSWVDVRLSTRYPGLKGGVMHKYLLRALYGATSLIPGALVLTPKSTLEKPKISKKNGENKELRMVKFSVDRGVRFAYTKVYKDGKPFLIDGKECYKEETNSRYIQDIDELFNMVFPNSNDIDKFWSFRGLVELIKYNLPNNVIEDVFTRFLNILWESNANRTIAQELEKGFGGLELDKKIKSSAVDFIMDEIPLLNKYHKDVNLMKYQYYSQYNKRMLNESKRI